MPVSIEKDDSKLKAWCQKELSKLLGFPVEEELVSYLMSMQTAKDVKEYLEDLLGTKSDAFQKEFLSHWHPPQRVPTLLGPLEAQILERPSQEDMVLFRGDGGGGSGGGKGGGSSSKTDRTKKDYSSVAHAPPPGFSRAQATPSSAAAAPPWKSSHAPDSHLTRPPPGLTSASLSTTRQSGGQRSVTSTAPTKKRKFVPLMSREGQSRTAMHLPGRHVCQCLAQKHDLVNNCVECGRIVCSQEGAGPCIFCGSLIFPPDEEKMLAKDSKKAQKIKEKLIKQYNLQEGERAFEHFKTVQSSIGLEKAVHHKDKLLDFDQTSAQRTHVLDDERDFFNVDATSWKSPQEKAALVQREEELREKKFGSHRNRAVTLDIAGRRVVEEHSEIDLYDEANVGDVKEKKMKKKANSGTTTREPTTDISNPSIPVERPRFRFDEGDGKGRRERGRPAGEMKEVALITRLQDRELQEMRDEGKCLSMHQPLASLLVEGIKQVEGRSWYTTHRGRLWIAAAAKVPSQPEIEQAEHFFRSLYGSDVMFPSDYPTSCLLGYVDVTDCLSQEEYREKVCFVHHVYIVEPH
jgi:hypothetical protein